MKTYYFTFGQTHVHRVNGFTYDPDVVCAIRASDESYARKIMFENFGDKWCFSYANKPDMSYFPRGIKHLN